MSQLFSSGGQSTGVSTSASVIPVNIQGCFSLGLTGLISLQCRSLSRVFSSNTVKCVNSLAPAFFMVQLSHPYIFHTGKTIALTIWIFVGKVMSLLFNTLFIFVLTFFQGVEYFNFMAAVTICSDFGTQ